MCLYEVIMYDCLESIIDVKENVTLGKFFAVVDCDCKIRLGVGSTEPSA